MSKFTVLLRRDLSWYVFYVWADSQDAATRTAKIHYMTGVSVAGG